MKGTPKPIHKTAKTWPVKYQNKPLWQHRQCASLSRVESHDLIGRKVNNNKGISRPVSVSQKRKQKHAVKCGRHYQKIKLQKTEVSHVKKSLKRLYTLRNRYLKPPGHEFSHNRDPRKQKQSQFPCPGKVRKVTNLTDLKESKTNRYLKRRVILGSEMDKPNKNRSDDKNRSDHNDEERKKNQKQHKDLFGKSKNSKSWQAKKRWISIR